MKRIRLRDRKLPDYTKGEEIMNMVTHIVGGSLGVIALTLCLIKACLKGGVLEIVCAIIFGLSMILLYTVSSVYHGLHPNMGKRVLQVIDHCTIYALIAGTYTPIALCAIRPLYPALGWGLLAWQWGLGILAALLTAIDLKKYNAFSMVCYIGMGWSILPFLPQTMAALTAAGFYLVFAGGVAYTVGAILYGIGSKMRWMHSVFHIFVVLGSVLHFLAIFLCVF